MKRQSLAVLIFILVASAAQAQLITTAETNGAGKIGLIASMNSSRYLGSDSSGGYVWLGYGKSDRVDLFVLNGWTSVGDETQYWGGVGANTRIGKALGFDVSTCDYVVTPFNLRNEASTVLVDLSVVASRHFGPVVGYTGVNAVIPVGNTNQSTFTPPKTEFQVPIGIAIPVGSWGFYGEADIGHIRTFGVGIAYTR